MLHPNRAHQIADRSTVPLEAFAQELADHTHVCCQGFRYRNLTLLNDATSEDGVQEFAVIRDDHHIDYLNCSWNDAEQVARLLEFHLSRNDPGYAEPTSLLPHPVGDCPLCA